jgi:hypothetical protein
MIAGVPGLLGAPLDDEALGVPLAVVGIDIEFAVVAAGGQPVFTILKSTSADIAVGRLAGASDNLQDIERLLRDG